MSDPLRWELMDRYFSGECSPEEIHEIERWIDATPRRRSQVEAMRTVWERAGRPSGTQWNAPAAWQRIAPEFQHRPTTAERSLALPSAEEGRIVRRIMRYALRIAALITLVAGSALLWSTIAPQPEHKHLLGANLREYAAPRGQRASFSLTDGTRVVLAPGSVLRVTREFSRLPHRDVYLEGQAFFEVTHDETRHFTVHTSYGDAEDLGTQFVVTAYAGDTAMRVVVAEGVVAVRGRDQPPARAEILQAGDLATINQQGQVATARRVGVGEYLSWISGQLVFRNATVEEVAVTLARWYDVDIRLATPAAGTRRVTLTTDPSQSFAEVLTALTLPAGMRAEWHEGAVILHE